MAQPASCLWHAEKCPLWRNNYFSVKSTSCQPISRLLFIFRNFSFYAQIISIFRKIFRNLNGVSANFIQMMTDFFISTAIFLHLPGSDLAAAGRRQPLFHTALTSFFSLHLKGIFLQTHARLLPGGHLLRSPPFHALNVIKIFRPPQKGKDTIVGAAEKRNATGNPAAFLLQPTAPAA